MITIDEETGPPTRPEAGEPDPEDPVPPAESGSGDGALQNGELIAQRQVLVEAQLRATPHAELFVAEHSDHATLIQDPEPAMLEAFRSFLARYAGARLGPNAPGCASTSPFTARRRL